MSFFFGRSPDLLTLRQAYYLQAMLGWGGMGAMWAILGVETEALEKLQISGAGKGVKVVTLKELQMSRPVAGEEAAALR